MTSPLPPHQSNTDNDYIIKEQKINQAKALYKNILKLEETLIQNNQIHHENLQERLRFIHICIEFHQLSTSLAKKYDIESRMWKLGIHSTIDIMKQNLNDDTFIYKIYEWEAFFEACIDYYSHFIKQLQIHYQKTHDNSTSNNNGDENNNSRDYNTSSVSSSSSSSPKKPAFHLRKEPYRAIANKGDIYRYWSLIKIDSSSSDSSTPHDSSMLKKTLLEKALECYKEATIASSCKLGYYYHLQGLVYQQFSPKENNFDILTILSFLIALDAEKPFTESKEPLAFVFRRINKRMDHFQYKVPKKQSLLSEFLSICILKVIGGVHFSIGFDESSHLIDLCFKTTKQMKPPTFREIPNTYWLQIIALIVVSIHEQTKLMSQSKSFDLSKDKIIALNHLLLVLSANLFHIASNDNESILESTQNEVKTNLHLKKQNGSFVLTLTWILLDLIFIYKNQFYDELIKMLNAKKFDFIWSYLSSWAQPPTSEILLNDNMYHVFPFRFVQEWNLDYLYRLDKLLDLDGSNILDKCRESKATEFENCFSIDYMKSSIGIKLKLLVSAKSTCSSSSSSKPSLSSVIDCLTLDESSGNIMFQSFKIHRHGRKSHQSQKDTTRTYHSNDVDDSTREVDFEKFQSRAQLKLNDIIDETLIEKDSNIEELKAKKLELENDLVQFNDHHLSNISITTDTTLVFDTNWYVDHLKRIQRVYELDLYTILIPLAVVTELDGLSTNLDQSLIASQAKEALIWIEICLETQKSSFTFSSNNNNQNPNAPHLRHKPLLIKTARNNRLYHLSIRNEDWTGLNDITCVDDVILLCCQNQIDVAGKTNSRNIHSKMIEKKSQLQYEMSRHHDGDGHHTGLDVLLVTDDVNLRLKAKTRNVSAVGNLSKKMFVN